MRHLVLLIFVATVMKSYSSFIPQYADECLEELSLDSSVLQELKENRNQNTEPSSDGKCLLLCCGEKAGFITDNQLNEAAVLAKIPTGYSVDLTRCAAMTGADDCDKFYQIFKCVGRQVL